MKIFNLDEAAAELEQMRQSSNDWVNEVTATQEVHAVTPLPTTLPDVPTVEQLLADAEALNDEIEHLKAENEVLKSSLQSFQNLSDLINKTRCTCGEPHISDKVVHCYDGKPCHLKPVDEIEHLTSVAQRAQRRECEAVDRYEDLKRILDEMAMSDQEIHDLKKSLEMISGVAEILAIRTVPDTTLDAQLDSANVRAMQWMLNDATKRLERTLIGRP